ncbi:hypothetical protein BJX63DRAFT_415992 [Aspergillus granulosus]|uniref:Uncharacterized protein n=1 Tax=Aspergillus granulosus TaxID=176169 RepID=A0ABR4GSK0_9EURO
MTGNRRIRKGSINQQEQLLDWFVRPTPDSSNNHHTRRSERRSSPTGDCPIDGSMLQRDRLSNLSQDFDLSFIPDPCQESDPQDGDNLSRAFLSTLLPNPSIYTPPEVSPPPSALDELSYLHLPPGDQFQSLPSLNATLLPSPTSPLLSSSQSCHCLRTVIFAVEEVETSCSTGNRAELDSVIAYQKDAIKRCCSMLKCSICLPRRENLVLLAFMAEKLVSSISQIVILYRMKANNTSTDTCNTYYPPPPSCYPTSIEGYRHDFTTTSSSSQLASDADYISPGWRKMFLGDYEISSVTEWEHIMGVLIELQIRGVVELLADMRNICGDALADSQMASLARAEAKLGELRREVSIL